MVTYKGRGGKKVEGTRIEMSCQVLNHVNALHNLFKKEILGFPGGAVVENLPASAGDTGSSPGLGRSHMPRSN